MNRDLFIQHLQQNQREDIEIVKSKNQDYAEGGDPFQNFRMVEDAGLVSLEKGIAVRMSDKMQRIFNLLDREASVDDETIADTLSDLRNYANILQVYLEQEKGGSEVEKQTVKIDTSKETKYFTFETADISFDMGFDDES